MKTGFEKLIVLLLCIGALLLAMSLTGCGHNTGAFLMGTSVKIGFDSQNAIPSITYVDGFMATDISRENSGWELEIDQSTGIIVNKDGSVKGIKRIKRFVGPQFNGYLTDLVEKNPELAKSYMDAVAAFWGSVK